MCWKTRPHPEEERAIHIWADGWAPRIAKDAQAVSALLDVLETDLLEDVLLLFALVLDAMRMNLEYRERDAKELLALVNGWMETTGAGLGSPEKMALCQAFLRASLPPPDVIRISPEDPEIDASMQGNEMPDISELMRDLLPEGAKDHSAFMILHEAMGSMPEQAAEAFVFEMIKQALPQHIMLARYFLLTPEPDLRLSTARGFADLARAGRINAALLSDLIQLRKWMPKDTARAALDIAIKEALRREASGGTAPRAWRLHHLKASLPDGTGSQSIAASVSRGSEKSIAMLLIKSGHGIKDAYAIPCASATEQRAFLAQIEEGVPMHDVSPDYLPQTLAQALDDHLPPAPGFLDVAQMLGLQEITPSDPADPCDIADPDGIVAGLSVQKHGRLISESIEWPATVNIASSWFISDADLSDALDLASTERQAEQAIWAAFEVQRDLWAMTFARAAAVLRHAEEPAWQSFAAVVHGISSGRALKKIPIFEMLVDLTLDVAEEEGFDALQDPFDDPYEDDYDTDIAPEGKGELARLLKNTPLSSHHLNGYLTAVLVAPEFTTPTEWLPPLMGGIEFAGEGSVQRLLDILMLRYGKIRDDMMDGNVGATLHDAAHFADWLSGFAQASAIKSAWPKKQLSKEDRKVLKLMSDAALEASIQETLKPLLPAWLHIMANRAMDG